MQLTYFHASKYLQISVLTALSSNRHPIRFAMYSEFHLRGKAFDSFMTQEEQPERYSGSAISYMIQALQQGNASNMQRLFC